MMSRSERRQLERLALKIYKDPSVMRRAITESIQEVLDYPDIGNSDFEQIKRDCEGLIQLADGLMKPYLVAWSKTCQTPVKQAPALVRFGLSGIQTELDASRIGHEIEMPFLDVERLDDRDLIAHKQARMRELEQRYTLETQLLVHFGQVVLDSERKHSIPLVVLSSSSHSIVMMEINKWVAVPYKPSTVLGYLRKSFHEYLLDDVAWADVDPSLELRYKLTLAECAFSFMSASHMVYDKLSKELSDVEKQLDCAKKSLHKLPGVEKKLATTTTELEASRKLVKHLRGKAGQPANAVRTVAGAAPKPPQNSVAGPSGIHDQARFVSWMQGRLDPLFS